MAVTLSLGNVSEEEGDESEQGGGQPHRAAERVAQARMVGESVAACTANSRTKTCRHPSILDAGGDLPGADGARPGEGGGEAQAAPAAPGGVAAGMKRSAAEAAGS